MSTSRTAARDISPGLLYKLAGVPLAILVLGLMVTLAVVTAIARLDDEKKAETLALSIVSANERYFSNEIVLNKDAAIRLRMTMVAAQVEHALSQGDTSARWRVCARLHDVLDKAFVPDAMESCTETPVASTALTHKSVLTVPIGGGGAGPDLARLSLELSAPAMTIADILPPTLVGSAAFALLLAALTLVLLVRGMRRGVIAPLLRTIEKEARDAAVGRMSQMLAHDVRKPFTILTIGMTQIERLADDPQGLRAYLPKVKKRLSEVLLQVNTMIADVMDASSAELTMARERADLRAIVGAAADQAFGFSKPTNVVFVEELNHQSQLEIDVSKVTRVLVNIISNAKDALKGGGVISVRSRDVGSLVEVSVHNTGSFVPPEMREALFESFFTHGKRGGTGLGLAIARKVVEAHGGTIRCDSDATTGTTFVFTIEASASSLVQAQGRYSLDAAGAVSVPVPAH